jgi:D-alanyl-lipoteichoic acid acyltransferase DltB (MBOAT superfamily)
LDVVTAFLNLEVDDAENNLSLAEGWLDGLNTPTNIVQPKKALYSLKHLPRLWHNNINTFLLSVEFTQSQGNPNLYLCSDGILMHL